MSSNYTDVSDILKSAKSADIPALDAYSNALRQIRDLNLHASLMNMHLQYLLREGLRSSLAFNGRFVDLHVSDDIRLDLIFYTSPPSALFTSPTEFAQMLICGGPVCIDVFKAHYEDASVLASGTSLRKQQSLTLNEGDIIPKDLNEVLNIQTPPGGRQIFMRLSGPVKHGFEWEFDLRTLSPKRIHSVDTARSNALAILHLLGEAGDPSSVPVIEALTSDEAHYIRWAALKSLHRIDKNIGHRYFLQAAISDPHPELKRAAQAVNDIEL